MTTGSIAPEENLRACRENYRRSSSTREYTKRRDLCFWLRALRYEDYKAGDWLLNAFVRRLRQGGILCTLAPRTDSSSRLSPC